MKLNFDLPILVRGRPKGSAAVTNVYGVTRRVADIPEVSLSEMPTVFEVAKRTDILKSVDVTPPLELRNELKIEELRETYRIHVFNGEYYRRIARSIDEAETMGIFRTPFDPELNGRLGEQYVTVSWRRSMAYYGGDISPAHLVAGNGPLARPLADEFEWLLDRESTSSLKSKTAWPRPAPRYENGRSGWHVHRNTFYIDSPETNIRDVPAEDMERANAMIRSQIDRLLIADGEIWIKTRPPAYKVQFSPAAYRGPPSRIEISLVTAPESYFGDLYTQHFSLADASLAEKAVRDLYGEESEWAEGFTKVVRDFRVPYECLDDNLLEYDYQQEEINRVGYTAAVEIRAFLERKPAYAQKLTQEQIEVIDRAFAATEDVNHLLGHHRDMSEFLPTLASAWRKLGHKQILTGGFALSNEAKIALSRALDYIDTAPISIDLQLAGPAPRRL